MRDVTRTWHTLILALATYDGVQDSLLLLAILTSEDVGNSEDSRALRLVELYGEIFEGTLRQKGAHAKERQDLGDVLNDRGLKGLLVCDIVRKVQTYFRGGNSGSLALLLSFLSCPLLLSELVCELGFVNL